MPRTFDKIADHPDSVENLLRAFGDEQYWRVLDLLACCDGTQDPKSFGEIPFMLGGNLGTLRGNYKEARQFLLRAIRHASSGEIITFWLGPCASMETSSPSRSPPTRQQRAIGGFEAIRLRSDHSPANLHTRLPRRSGTPKTELRCGRRTFRTRRGTEILFIKVPPGNDKVPVDTTPEVEAWFRKQIEEKDQCNGATRLLLRRRGPETKLNSPSRCGRPFRSGRQHAPFAQKGQ
jgi:hypothetical protein